MNKQSIFFVSGLLLMVNLFSGCSKYDPYKMNKVYGDISSVLEVDLDWDAYEEGEGIILWAVDIEEEVDPETSEKIYKVIFFTRGKSEWPIYYSEESARKSKIHIGDVIWMSLGGERSKVKKKSIKILPGSYTDKPKKFTSWPPKRYPVTVPFYRLKKVNDHQESPWEITSVVCVEAVDSPYFGRSYKLQIKGKGKSDSRGFSPGQRGFAVAAKMKGSDSLNTFGAMAFHYPAVDAGEEFSFEINALAEGYYDKDKLEGIYIY